MTQYQLHGFRELEEKLLALADPAAAKRMARKALRDAGKPLLAAYKSRTKIKSGALVASETLGSKLNRRQRRLSSRPGPSEVEIHIGTSDPAGIQEEFGHRQAANPALTSAWDSEGGVTAIERIGKSLGDSIERRARRDGKG